MGFAVLVSDVSTSLSFEGTTVNDHQTSFKFVDPSHDNLITFPDVTGTVITSGNIVDLTESMRDLKIISMEVSGESNLLGPLSLNGDFKVGDSTFTIDKASGNTIVKGTATVEDRSKLVGNVTLGDHADILTAGSKRKVMLKQNAMHAWSFVDGGVAFESVAYDDGNGVVVTTVGTHPFGTNDAVLISDVQGSTELNEKLFVVEKESDVSFKLRGSMQISQNFEYVGGGKAVKVSSSHARPVNPTGISRTKPSYARIDAHGYDTRDVILFEDIPGGMSENLNGEEFIVLNNSGVNQFSYGYLNGTEVDARSFQPFEDSGTGRVGKLNRLVRNRTARILNITNDGKVTVEYPHDFEKGDIIVIGGVESGSGSGI